MMEKEDCFPTIRQAVWLLVAASLAGIIPVVFFGVLGDMLNLPLIEHLAVQGLINLFAIGLVITWSLEKMDAPFLKVFSFAPVARLIFIPLTLIGLGFSILLSELDNLFRYFLPMNQELIDLFNKLISPQTNWWESLFLLVIIAPLTEELLFRGLILRGFLNNYSANKAIVVSALLFAVFHFNPWQFSGAFIMGIFFAWLVVKTGSLIPCLFGHALNNALPLVVMALGIEIRGFTSPLGPQAVFQPLWFNLLGLFLAGLGLVLLFWMFRHRASTNEQEKV